MSISLHLVPNRDHAPFEIDVRPAQREWLARSRAIKQHHLQVSSESPKVYDAISNLNFGRVGGASCPTAPLRKKEMTREPYNREFEQAQQQMLNIGAGICMYVQLKNASHLPPFERRMLREAFEDELFGRFGTAGAMYLAYTAWKAGEPSTWPADVKSAYAAIESTMSAAEVKGLSLNLEFGAHFEVEFIHDIN